MAFILADRVKETTTSPGTGTATLNGAQTGYQSFSAGIGANNTTYYVIADQGGANWEVGYGTIGAGGTTLARTTVLASSNSGSLVNFASGTQDVWCDYPASKQISSDYPNALGVTTPNTGTFTTLTAQTEVLKGTGQNYFQQSQTFTNVYWGYTFSSATANTTTAPDGTLTASTLTADGTTNAHYFSNSVADIVGAHTVSIYAKKNTNNYLQIAVGGTAADYANYDLNAGTATAFGSAVATITSAANGFYRCSLYTPSTVATGARFAIVSSTSAARLETNSLSTSVYIWGAQSELSTTAGTYTVTTTTAIYGTPSLSFSGVAGLGLQSDGSLYVSPAGTGALQAQATTSSSVGGNARGANAVDWQTSRGSAGQVASGANSVIGGGGNNTSSGSNSTVVGGFSNQATNTDSFIGGGGSNQATANRASVVGGDSNLATGFFNFIGGGQANSGTANASVTSQATTSVTSGSTAVTLSGSNASIKVGQLITGTGMANFTYVAAISGTSLTLSQNANATGTPTLSFYTPHGVVVGGGNNQATGAYSFIGGGGDAGTAANRNVASGDWSAVVGGSKNTASGIGSFVGGGGLTAATATSANTASGLDSFIGAGLGNTASASVSSILGGANSVANGNYSAILGGSLGTARSISGNTVIPACNTPIVATAGVAQGAFLILGRATTDATATVLTCDQNAAGTTNQVILPNNSAYYFKARVISGVTGAGNTKAWTLEGAIKRGANAASTAIVGSVTTTVVAADAGASTWTVTATADTTNGGLAITFTGQAGTTIRTVCKIETAEMTY